MLGTLTKFAKDVSHPGWQTCIGGVLMHLVLGSLYCWGIITYAVTAHLRKYDESVTYNKSLMVYAAALLFQGLTMLLGGVLENRVGARKTTLLGGYILVLGTFLSATVTSLDMLVLCDGALFGIGMGISYTAPIACAAKWLPHRKGLLSGIIVGGFGGGAFVFGQIATTLLRAGTPYNDALLDGYYQSDSSIANNVPLMFFGLGSCYFVLVSLSGYFIVDYIDESDSTVIPSDEITSINDGQVSPSGAIAMTKRLSGSTYQSTMTKDILYDDSGSGRNCELFATVSPLGHGLDRDNSAMSSMASTSASSRLCRDSPDISRMHTTHNINTDEEGRPSSGDEIITSVSLTSWEIIRTPLAWHVASCFVTTTIGGMYLAGTYKTFLLASFANADERTNASRESFISTVGEVAAIFNAGGRVLWGGLADNVGNLPTLMMLSFVFASLIASFSYAPALGRPGIAAWTCGLFLCEGGNFALYMPLIVELFGPKYAGSNYGLIFSFYSMCNVINISALAAANVSFHTATMVTSITTALGLVNLILLKEHIRRSREVRVVMTR